LYFIGTYTYEKRFFLMTTLGAGAVPLAALTADVLAARSSSASINLATAVDLRELALQDVEQLSATSATLKVALISHNALSLIGPGVLSCAQLRKLDLSSNGLASLPVASAWANLAQLQVLYLHSNALSSLRLVEELSPLEPGEEGEGRQFGERTKLSMGSLGHSMAELGAGVGVGVGFGVGAGNVMRDGSAMIRSDAVIETRLSSSSWEGCASYGDSRAGTGELLPASPRSLLHLMSAVVARRDVNVYEQVIAVQTHMIDDKRHHAATLRAELKQAHAELQADKELERQELLVQSRLERRQLQHALDERHLSSLASGCLFRLTVKPYDRGVFLSHPMRDYDFQMLCTALADSDEAVDFDKVGLIAAAAGLNYFNARQVLMMMGTLDYMAYSNSSVALFDR
jgi:hypothetical protein